MTDIAALYEERAATRSDIWEHMPTLVGLVVGADAQHVIELGVNRGNSTVAFLYGLEKTGGTLTSVDCSAHDLGSWPRWEFVFGDDLDPDVIGRMTPADILFVDTTHTYAQTVGELDAYWRLVRPGGLIVCHDTELVAAGTRPVTDAIDEFCREHGLAWANEPRCGGLGVIRTRA